jgi:hypothetical protein
MTHVVAQVESHSTGRPAWPISHHCRADPAVSDLHGPDARLAPRGTAPVTQCQRRLRALSSELLEFVLDGSAVSVDEFADATIALAPADVDLAADPVRTLT